MLSLTALINWKLIAIIAGCVLIVHVLDFLAKHNPFGQIPSLYDGDYHVFESRAIIAYIANAYDKTGTLNPKVSEKRVCRYGLLNAYSFNALNIHER